MKYILITNNVSCCRVRHFHNVLVGKFEARLKHNMQFTVVVVAD